MKKISAMAGRSKSRKGHLSKTRSFPDEEEVEWAEVLVDLGPGHEGQRRQVDDVLPVFGVRLQQDGNSQLWPKTSRAIKWCLPNFNAYNICLIGTTEFFEFLQRKSRKTRISNYLNPFTSKIVKYLQSKSCNRHQRNLISRTAWRNCQDSRRASFTMKRIKKLIFNWIIF